jgi:hypothetical protein
MEKKANVREAMGFLERLRDFNHNPRSKNPSTKIKPVKLTLESLNDKINSLEAEVISLKFSLVQDETISDIADKVSENKSEIEK